MIDYFLIFAESIKFFQERINNFLRVMLATIENSTAQKLTPILLIDNNDNDVLLYKRAFSKTKANYLIHRVSNGDEAIAYLDRESKYDRKQYRLPELILLDLKLPVRCGLEVLFWIGQQPKFKNTKIVVVSDFITNLEIQLAMDYGANKYFIKPIKWNNFLNLVKSISVYCGFVA